MKQGHAAGKIKAAALQRALPLPDIYQVMNRSVKVRIIFLDRAKDPTRNKTIMKTTASPTDRCKTKLINQPLSQQQKRYPEQKRGNITNRKTALLFEIPLHQNRSPHSTNVRRFCQSTPPGASGAPRTRGSNPPPPGPRRRLPPAQCAAAGRR